MNVQDASCATKALVPAAKVDASNAILTQHGGTHDARLDGDIEVGLVEDIDGILGQDTSNSDKFSVPGTIEGSICLVHASTNDVAVLDKDTTDRCFIALQCKLGLFG